MRSDRTSFDDVSDVLLHAERWTVVHAATMTGPDDGARPPARRRTWSRVNAHTNDSLEILLSVRGEDWFGMRGTMHRCRPGCLFLIDPGVPHDAFYPETASGLEHIWLRLLSDRVFVNWLAIDGGRYVRLHEHITILHQEQLGVLTSPFADGVRDPKSAFDAIRLRLVVGMIASHLAEQAADPAASTAILAPKPESIQRNVAAAIQRHIDDTSGKGVTLDSLAHFSGYSKFHLSRIFRTWIGCSIHQYIDTARRRKMEAMKAVGASNGAVAETLGFSEASAYLRWRRAKRISRR